MKLNLPSINFIDTNAETIQNEMIDSVEIDLNKKLYPGDPIRLIVLSMASLIVQQRVLMNNKMKQTLLAYATGDILDHFGADSHTLRDTGSPAVTTVRFTLSTAQAGAVVIPLYTRVSPDGATFFQTKESAQINAGSFWVDVLCESLTVGVNANGYLPGQINRIVDPDNVPYLQSVSNLTTSSGGTDRETDDHYRERIYLAPESFSVAGPEGAYEYWAKTANSDISDVFVDTPSAGEVAIYPLMISGNVPSTEVLDAVLAACSSKKVRPMTDLVSVHAPTQTIYDTTLTYWINKDDEDNAVSIQAAVSSAISDYQAWQKAKLGRDINPDELRRRVLNAGAKRIIVTSPAYTALDRAHIAHEGITTITYGGLEDA